jgi:hypothetical protein
MRRVPMFVAAGVTTAIIVLGINALAPVRAQESGRHARSDLATKFSDCLRDHGVAVPQLRGTALDRWFKSADVSIETARACKTALAGEVEKGTSADTRKLTACLRTKGLAAPSDPVKLKEWIGRQDRATIDRALEDCGPAPEPPCGAPKDE